MKKILLLSIALFTQLFCVAQITTLKVEPTEDTNIKTTVLYDSLTNIPMLNRKTLLKGQTLHYIGCDWDIDCNEITCDFQIIKRNGSFKSLKNSIHLRGKCFLLDDIKNEDHNGKIKEYWYLTNKENGDRFRYEASKHFIINYRWVCVGHIEKLKSLYVGREFYFMGLYVFYNAETKDANYDIPVDSRWKCVDVSIESTIPTPNQEYLTYHLNNTRILLVLDNNNFGRYFTFYHKKDSEIPGESFNRLFMSGEMRAEAERQEELRIAEAERQEELRIAEAERLEELRIVEAKQAMAEVERQAKLRQAKAEQREKLRIAKAKQQAKQRRTRLYNTYGEDIANIILQQKVRIGMTSAMCIESWGRPSDINKTIGAWGVHEQWVYGLSSYLYFEDGVLTTIQN